ncbi:sodium-dependent lysophosphatidylcholine symporter 1-like isoform X2 [Ambystoma mexicanum]|uniref:sodium-dependent lysophosphatidylcholine symporter 1-like isoform X2 n=1 Tax=Ambystoma mexicanum TaxID=8296 RepID=UPI0037E7006F
MTAMEDTGIPLSPDRRRGSSAMAEAPPYQKTPPLPICRKVCYALGGAPYQLTGNAIGFFLQIFLLDVVQLSPFHAAMILFLGRAWDAISDPSIGFLVSGSPRRKFGKLMPWIVASTPLGVLCYFFLWFSPSNSTSVPLKFLWFLAMYCFFQTCLSCYHVPYTSLTMFLGGSQRDRDSATAYRMGVEVTSTLIGAGIQGQIVGGYHASMADMCSSEKGTFHNGTFLNRALLNSSLLNNTSILTDSLENTQWAYSVAAMVIGGLYCISSLILFLGVKEQPDFGSSLQTSRLPFITSLKMVLGHTPYAWLLMGFLSASLAFQLAQGIFAFFCTHAADLGGSFQHLVLIMLVAACLSIPFWQNFLVKFGKKTAVILGLSCFIPPLIVITLVTNNFVVFAFMMVVTGFSAGVLYLLPWSMLPDSVDDFKVKNPDCRNLEAFFYSFYIFFNKFAGGLSLGMSTLSLQRRAEDAMSELRSASVIGWQVVPVGPYSEADSRSSTVDDIVWSRSGCLWEGVLSAKERGKDLGVGEFIPRAGH